MGIRNLSVPASAIGPLKVMIRSLTLSELTGYMHQLVDSSSEASVRRWIANWAHDHNVTV